MNQLREQLLATSTPLQDYQANQLQEIMKLERNTGNSTGRTSATPEERIASLEDYQNRVLQRAQGILQPTQIEALKTQQQTRISFLQAATQGGATGAPPPPGSP